jgi:protein-tyrosine-phosphatase
MGLDKIDAGQFEVRSAGTAAVAGRAMQPHSCQIVRDHGGTSAEFVVRHLTE